MQIHGPDISHYQGSPDFNALRGGADFVILKCSQATFSDATYGRNLGAARAAGLLVGAYHFAAGGDPVAEANYFATRSSHAPGELAILDWEISNGNPDAWCAAWCNQVKQRLGVTPVIYMNSSTANKYSWAQTRATGALLWVANYGPNNGRENSAPSVHSWGSYIMWQYTSTGRVAGISGNVDLNNFYGDANQWRSIGAGTTFQGGSGSGVPTTIHVPTTNLPIPLPQEDDDMLPTIIWCFTALMGREPTPEEVIFQLDNSNGANSAVFAETFLDQKAEPSAHIKAYVDILHRTADQVTQAEIDQRAGMSIRQVRAALSTAAAGGAK